MTTPARRLIGGDNLVWFNGDDFRILQGPVGEDAFGFHEDFVGTDVASDVLPGWTTTLVEAGTGESTVTLGTESGGTLVLTTDDNENDGINLQMDGEAFELTSGQSATYFGTRIKVNDADQTDLLVGLCITDTTLLGGMTDGVYFESLDESASLSFVTEKNTSETQTDTLGTLVDDTFIVLEFAFDGTNVFAFIDGVLVATHTANIPDDEALTPSIHFLTGEAVANICTIDWVRAIQVGR